MTAVDLLTEVASERQDQEVSYLRCYNVLAVSGLGLEGVTKKQLVACGGFVCCVWVCVHVCTGADVYVCRSGVRGQSWLGAGAQRDFSSFCVRPSQSLAWNFAK